MNTTDTALQNQWLHLRTVGEPSPWKGALEALPDGVRLLPALPLSVMAAQEWVDKTERSGEEVHGLLVPYRTQEDRQRFDRLFATRHPTWMFLVAVCAEEPDARRREQALVAALECGADEAVNEPLEIQLLVARLQARCRSFYRERLEVREAVAVEEPTEWLLAGERLRLDMLNRKASLDGEPLDLTPKEMDLLAFLASRMDQCCTRDQILDSVWGIDFVTATNTVDVYVYFLRRKLKQRGLSGLFETVRNAGYRLKSNGSYGVGTENETQREADGND